MPETRLQLTQMGKMFIFHSYSKTLQSHGPKFKLFLWRDVTLPDTMICQGLNYTPALFKLFTIHIHTWWKNSSTSSQQCHSLSRIKETNWHTFSKCCNTLINAIICDDIENVHWGLQKSSHDVLQDSSKLNNADINGLYLV